MEFGLLGPLRVRYGGAEVPVPAGRQRAVLAGLLLNAGRQVSVDELAEVLWGSAPPPSARVTVQNYVMRLRRALGERGRDQISTRPGGYLIEVGELDVTRFQEHLSAAQAAALEGSWATASGQARAALALWRGEPLADVDSELLAAREIPHLAELRLQALEARIDADLHLGHHSQVIAEARHLAATHPLREHLHASVMLALYRDDRQAEALAAYQTARQILIQELGTEPGPGLQQLHQQILTADPALACPPPRAAACAADWAELTALLGKIGARSLGTVMIVTLSQDAGHGTTAPAICWTGQAASRFPDGPAQVDPGHIEPSPPMTDAGPLARLLHAVGVPSPSSPSHDSGAAGTHCEHRRPRQKPGRRRITHRR